jgi:hypothetical protein
MNTNIFEEDPPALFEEDEQYTNAYDEILQNIYESNKQVKIINYLIFTNINNFSCPIPDSKNCGIK